MDRDEDAPQPRPHRAVPDATVAETARTRVHRSGTTTDLPGYEREPKLSVQAPPVRLVQPTEILACPFPQADAPEPPPLLREDENTRQVAAADADRLPSSETTDRIAIASEQLLGVSELLGVDRRNITAQLLAGISAGLIGGQTSGAVEYVGAHLVTRLLLADAGVGGRFNEDHLANAMIELATAIIAGVEPHRRAARHLATECEAKAKSYRILAKQHLDAGKTELATQFITRADEREAQARELIKAAR